ncbi:MAG: hypothetical protein LKM37_04720 [Bacteroidales bacterium]|jgi:exopolyphosphatase/guanosine-5'-triphosphate,3'-diphosphate pyrophosphatase|nr:hypothetical protein [Bacteroidales bacterium]MCI1733813.1 hypothetical protein [Bacteroidales bacterium]
MSVINAPEKPRKIIAVIDMGTNVFNLLVAEVNMADVSIDGVRQKRVKYICLFKAPSRIGAAGLADGVIKPVAFETASDAMKQILWHVKKIEGQYNTQVPVYPFATSAVRDAKNGREFVSFMDERFGIDIQVISGDVEAMFIFRGVMLSVPQFSKKIRFGCASATEPDERMERSDFKRIGSVAEANADAVADAYNSGDIYMLLDIGGGSDEFIITDGAKILWEHSFPIGMARMRERFNYSEPIKNEVIDEFLVYCDEALQILWEKIKEYKPKILIGSSGTFDTFKDLIYDCGYRDKNSITLPLGEMEKLYERLLPTTKAERMRIRGMNSIRENYIVLGIIFVRFILRRMKETSGPEIQLWQSSFSLREGAMDKIVSEL